MNETLIYCMHGVVKNKKADAFNFSQRIFLDFDQFEEYLKNRPAKFIDIDEAIAEGKGEVLTIDDACIGGGDAALLAAKHQHHVSLFINPYYIENQQAYYFSYLNYLLENIPQTASLKWSGKTYFIKEINDKYRLRQILKHQLRQLKTEEERKKLLQNIAQQIGLKMTMEQLPRCAQTLTKNQLSELAANPYVRIENHGWTHTCISVLKEEEIQEEVQKSQDWIEANCHQKPVYYVIPFGDQIVPDSCKLSAKLFFLEDSRFYRGFIGERIYNRTTLQI